MSQKNAYGWNPSKKETVSFTFDGNGHKIDPSDASELADLAEESKTVIRSYGRVFVSGAKYRNTRQVSAVELADLIREREGVKVSTEESGNRIEKMLAGSNGQK